MDYEQALALFREEEAARQETRRLNIQARKRALRKARQRWRKAHPSSYRDTRWLFQKSRDEPEPYYVRMATASARASMTRQHWGYGGSSQVSQYCQRLEDGFQTMQEAEDDVPDMSLPAELENFTHMTLLKTPREILWEDGFLERLAEDTPELVKRPHYKRLKKKVTTTSVHIFFGGVSRKLVRHGFHVVGDLIGVPMGEVRKKCGFTRRQLREIGAKLTQLGFQKRKSINYEEADEEVRQMRARRQAS